jgi:ribonuclease G
MMGKRIMLKVHPETAELLLGEERRVVESLEQWLHKEIVIHPEPQFHLEQWEMYEVFDK